MTVETSVQALTAGVLRGDLRSLARAATLIESQTQTGRELITALFPYTGKGKLIGITGPPGAGKSTLVDQIAACMRSEGQTVGILAVDPSSAFTGGAILGDRIRMQRHHDDAGVFIRSMATRGTLGGIANATLELALLLDAAGRQTVIIETVGVGQDEIDVAQLAQLVIVVLTPGSGDDVQAVKAGIMEIADVFAINKSELPGADRLEQEIRAMQSFGTEDERQRAAPIRRVSAITGAGITELLSVMREVYSQRVRTGLDLELWEGRLRHMLQEQINREIPQRELAQLARKVASREQDPYSAVQRLRQIVSTEQVA